MNIFIREMKANRKALIIWSVCMFLLVVSGMSKYTAYSSGGAASDVFQKMPYSMKALLGVGSFDVTKISGFFAFMFMYIEITAAIHAVMLGSGIIAKEERDKTTEFLMVKPVSRTTVITSKFFAALVNVAVIGLVSFASSVLMVGAYNKGKDITGEVAVFFVSMFLVQLVFLSLGMMFAAAMKRPKASGSVATSIMMGTFIIAKITDFTDRINAINVLSPFKYFSYKDIVDGKGLNTGIVLITVLIIAVFTAFTYFFYRNRDLRV
jgi:Putative exporter of polyketide antibiotics